MRKKDKYQDHENNNQTGNHIQSASLQDYNNMPRKKLGFYAAREVDPLMEAMRRQQETLQESYQERFEDQRISLLSVSRERDEARKKAVELEARLAEASDWEKMLADKGLVAVEKDRLVVLEEMEARCDQLSRDFEQQQADLEQVNHQLSHIKQVNADFDQLQTLISKQNKEISDANSNIQRLEAALTQEKHKSNQFETQFEETRKAKAELLKRKNEQIKTIARRYHEAMNQHLEGLRQLTETHTDYMTSLDQLNQGMIDDESSQ